MTTTLDRVFGVRTLTESAIKLYKQRPYDMHLQNLFKQGKKHMVDDGSRKFEYDKVILPKTAAPITGRDDEFKPLKENDKKNETGTCFDIKLMKHIPASKLFGLRGPGEIKANAPAVVADELEGLLKQINTTRELLAAQTLKGSVSIGPAQIPSMENTVGGYTFGVTSYNVAASWQTDGTKILSSELKALKTAYFRAARLPLGKLLIDNEVQAHLIDNTEVSAYLQAGSETARAALMANPEVAGTGMDAFRLGGVDWEVNENGYDVSGSFTKYIGDNYLIGLPKPEDLPTVLGWAECKGEIPKGAISSGVGPNGLIGLAPSEGIYAFAEVCTNPVGIKLYVGWAGTFLLMHEAAVLVESDVTTTS